MTKLAPALLAATLSLALAASAQPPPHIGYVYPAGGRQGTSFAVTLGGQSLDGVTNVFVSGASRPSNRVPFAVDALPECLEAPENSPTNAQPVELPVVVNGRLEAPGDVDCYRFEGRAGERLVAEVLARRLDSPLDSFLKLTDAAGRQLAFNDDHEDKASGLDTHHADSYVAATLPSNGAYCVHVSDTQRHAAQTSRWRHGQA